MNHPHSHDDKRTSADTAPQNVVGMVSLCHNCHHVVNSGALHLSDGRWICSSCQPSVVRNQWQINWVFERVKAFLATEGITLPNSIYIRIDNAASMNALMNIGGSEVNFAGMATSQVRRSSSTVVKSRHRVNVVNGLHRAFFAGVLAHELLHVWQNVRNIKLEQMLCEGFCEMGCYLMLNHIDNAIAHTHMQLMLNGTDPVYNDGFRKMKQRYERLAHPNLTNLMRATLARNVYQNLQGLALQAAIAQHQL